MKRNIKAEWGTGAMQLEPSLPFRPSLPRFEQRLSQLMKKFMDRDQNRISDFQRKYSMNQLNTTPFIHQVSFDPAPLYQVYANNSIIKSPIRYNLLRPKSVTKGR